MCSKVGDFFGFRCTFQFFFLNLLNLIQPNLVEGVIISGNFLEGFVVPFESFHFFFKGFDGLLAHLEDFIIEFLPFFGVLLNLFKLLFIIFDHPFHILRIESVPVLFNPLQKNNWMDLLWISDVSIVEFDCFSLRIEKEKAGKIFLIDFPIIFEGSLLVQRPVLTQNVHQRHKVMVGNGSHLVLNVKHDRKVVVIHEVKFWNVVIWRQNVSQCHIPVVFNVKQEADIVFHAIDLSPLIDHHVSFLVSKFLKRVNVNHFGLAIAVEDRDKVPNFSLLGFRSLTFFIFVVIVADGVLGRRTVLFHSRECLKPWHI